MKEDFRAVTDFPKKSQSKEVINQIKEEPFTDDDKANQLSEDYPGIVEKMMTPVTIIKEEFEHSIKEEPAEDSIPTEFVDVGQSRCEETEIKTEEECESETQGTSSELVNNHFPVQGTFKVMESVIEQAASKKMEDRRKYYLTNKGKYGCDLFDVKTESLFHLNRHKKIKHSGISM